MQLRPTLPTLAVLVVIALALLAIALWNLVEVRP